MAALGVLVEARGGVRLRSTTLLLLRGFLLGEPGCADLRTCFLQRIELLVLRVIRAFNAGCHLTYALRRQSALSPRGRVRRELVPLLDWQMDELWRRFLGVLCELGRGGDNLVGLALAEARRLPEPALGLRALGSLVHRFGLFYGLYTGACLVDWPQGHGQVLQVRLGVRPLFAELEVVERGSAANAWL